MKVIVPMAGLGSRFVTAGYDTPKPLIDVFGAPMIQRVVDSLGLQVHPHIFIVQRQHHSGGPLERDVLFPIRVDSADPWRAQLRQCVAVTGKFSECYQLTTASASK